MKSFLNIREGRRVFESRVGVGEEGDILRFKSVGLTEGRLAEGIRQGKEFEGGGTLRPGWKVLGKTESVPI